MNVINNQILYKKQADEKIPVGYRYCNYDCSRKLDMFSDTQTNDINEIKFNYFNPDSENEISVYFHFYENNLVLSKVGNKTIYGEKRDIIFDEVELEINLEDGNLTYKYFKQDIDNNTISERNIYWTSLNNYCDSIVKSSVKDKSNLSSETINMSEDEANNKILAELNSIEINELLNYIIYFIETKMKVSLDDIPLIKRGMLNQFIDHLEKQIKIIKQ